MDTTYFNKFAFLLNEEKTGDEKAYQIKDSMPDFGTSPNEPEDLVEKMAHLLKSKIRAHSGLEAELCEPSEVLERNGKTLAPIMYRIFTENFIKTSNSTFKLIECRNSTKLATDWKPRLHEILMASGHQVIIVDLKECFSPHNDFAYAVLRQINYNWRIRLPRSFFYPDDVCAVEYAFGEQLLLVTPLMPDGEMEFPVGVKKTLQYDILMMLKASCESAMENHLLMRDLRVGKFAETFDGVSSIRSVYRSLQERVRDGKEISLEMSSSHDGQLYMLSGAGDTIMSAEALLKECKQLEEGGGGESRSRSSENCHLDNEKEEIKSGEMSALEDKDELMTVNYEKVSHDKEHVQSVCEKKTIGAEEEEPGENRPRICVPVHKESLSGRTDLNDLPDKNTEPIAGNYEEERRENDGESSSGESKSQIAHQEEEVVVEIGQGDCGSLLAESQTVKNEFMNPEGLEIGQGDGVAKVGIGGNKRYMRNIPKVAGGEIFS